MKPTADDLKNVWNVNRGDMLRCESLDLKDRRRLCELRLQEVPDLPRWARAIQRAAASAFCTGNIPGKDGQAPFVAAFDWILRRETLVMIEEGQFDDRGPREIKPPDSISPQKDSSYWDRPKPIFSLSAEETARCENAGLQALADERKLGRRLTKSEMNRLIESAVVTTSNVVPFTQKSPAPIGPPASPPEEFLDE